MRRNRNIVIKSQFNINGSRGKSVYGFISSYVARESATDKYSGYLPKTHFEYGDGHAFTSNSTAITKKETLYIAKKVDELHKKGKHAIQQMVISFDHDYLIEQNIIDDDIMIIKKGDYQYNYDDVRLRYAIQAGINTMINKERYKDGKFIACIQHDTRHLHAHVCVWEDGPVLGRIHKNEERGIIKASNLSQIALHIDRSLKNTKTKTVITENKLKIKKQETTEDIKHEPAIDLNLLLQQFAMLEDNRNSHIEDIEKEEEYEEIYDIKDVNITKHLDNENVI